MRSLLLSLFCLAAVVVTSVTGATPESQEAWHRIESDNFTVLGDASEARLIEFADRLEQFRRVLSLTSEGMKLASPIPTHIFVFRDAESMAPYNLGSDGRPEAVSGYFLRALDANFVAIDASAETMPYAVLYHEYVHYVLENSVPAIPLWLNEGLAEFYSTLRLDETSAVIGLPVEEHLAWLSSHRNLSFDAIFDVTTSSPDYNEGERRGTFYAQSWALVHYLLVEPTTRRQMGTLLELFGNGVPSDKAFAQAFGIDILTAEKRLAEHVAGGAGRYFRYDFPQGQGPKDQAISASPVERKDLLLRLGDLLAHRIPMREQEAEEHLRGALALDSNSTDAHTALAVLRMRQGRLDEALDTVSRALKQSPDDARALSLRGAIHLQRFGSSVQKDVPIPDELRAMLVLARNDFRKVLAAAPEHFNALLGLGQTYIVDKEDAAEGLSALALASRLRPSRTDVLAYLIALTAAADNVEGAQNLLDRGLLPRGDAEAIQLAEEAIVEASMHEVEDLLRRDDPAAALKLAEDMTERVTSPELRRRLVEWSGGFSAEYRAEILRREAVAAGAAGDRARAEELMRQAGEIYGHGETAESETDLYNRGVALANQGDREAAAELFERIAATTTRPDLQAQSRNHASELRGSLELASQAGVLDRAIAALNVEDYEQAESLLNGVLERDLPEELRRRAEQLLRSARRSDDHREESALFAEAVELANQGDREAAAELFDDIAATTARPDLKALCKENSSKMRAAIESSRAIARYNEAVGAANAGELDQAESILASLLEKPLPLDLRTEAQQLLRTVQQLNGGREQPQKKRKKKRR